jgi:hypothetical protein
MKLIIIEERNAFVSYSRGRNKVIQNDIIRRKKQNRNRSEPEHGTGQNRIKQNGKGQKSEHITCSFLNLLQIFPMLILSSKIFSLKF